MSDTALHSTDVFLRRAILNLLASGQSTAEALAALLNIDLARTRATLADLLAQGRVVRAGILYEIQRRAA